MARYRQAQERRAGTPGMLITFAGALMLLTATLYALRGGLSTPAGAEVGGLDLQGVGFGAISVVLAGWYFGPLYGLALVLTVLIHEFGHVAAFRVTGHLDTPFRLVPLAGKRRGGTDSAATEAEEFFVAIAGSALSLGPMVLAFTLAEIVDPLSRPLANFFWILAATIAALNFLNLMPLWPLDGGRCVRAIIRALDRGAAVMAAIAMSAAFALAALAVESTLLLIAAVTGALTTAAGRTTAGRAPMAPPEAWLAFGAYAFTALAHFAGGALLLAVYL